MPIRESSFRIGSGRYLQGENILADLGAEVLRHGTHPLIVGDTTALSITRDVIENEHYKQNVINTMRTLLQMDIIPVVNENDTVAIDELVGQKIGDNDTLSAIVALLCSADLLVILTDIDALYDADPRSHPDAKRIPVVEGITEEILALGGGAGSNRGTGGMYTKLTAAKLANTQGISVVIAKGDEPALLYDIADGKSVGTLFLPPVSQRRPG